MATVSLEHAEIFPWNVNFATGIEVIDLQHQKLVELVNLLANHFAYQADLPTLSGIFEQLTRYAVYHFETEEAVWLEYFPDDKVFTNHLSSHQDFIETIAGFQHANQHKDLNQIVEDILSFLTQWLAFHILDSDKRMAIAVKGMQAGLSLNDAKIRADAEMSGSMQVLIKTILAMYDSLSNRTINLMKEINRRQVLERKLRLCANVIENTLDGICVTDERLGIIETNPAFCQSSGCDPVNGIGQNLKRLKSGLTEPVLFAAIKQSIYRQGYWSGEVKSHNAGGELESEWLTISAMNNDDGSSISNYIAVFSNVSQLLKRQQSLEKAAYHDALTGLPNRMLFADRLSLAISRHERTGLMLGVCYLDLDGFKPVNDSLGHAAGDQLLCEISNRHHRVLRDNDTVARFGGDEFVILLENLNSEQDCKELLGRLLNEVSRPMTINDKDVQVSASIGIALFPRHANTAEQLIQLADQAMYRAKNAGKSNFQFA